MIIMVRLKCRIFFLLSFRHPVAVLGAVSSSRLAACGSSATWCSAATLDARCPCAALAAGLSWLVGISQLT